MLHPRADGHEDRAMAIHMIKPVLRIILHDENHGVLPAGTVRYQFHGKSERSVVVLHEALIGPGRTLRVNIEGTAAVIIRIVEVHIRRQFAHALVTVYEM